MEIKDDEYKNMRQKAIEFVKNHNKLYGFIEFHCLVDVLKTMDVPDLYVIELAREVLDELGYIPKEHNIYERFSNVIDDVHGIDNKNIVEIGGGRFPRLAKRLKLKQKNGSITVYDPNLHTECDTERFKLKKKRANAYTDVNDCNLIIGLMPCKGAETLLDLALSNKKNFVLWLCEGGPHGDEFDFFEDEDEWRNYMIDRARSGVESNGMGKLKVKMIDEFSDKYPIIYNER